MKRNTFFLCLLLVGMQAANAQLTKGNWLVGGTGNFSSDNVVRSGDPELKSTNFSFLPNVGYFILNKFAAGLNAGVAHSKSNSTSVTTYSAGPFARYYLLNIEKPFNLFIHGSYRYATSRIKNFGIRSSNDFYNYSISGGPVIYFNSSVGLEFSIGYSHLKSFESNAKTNSLQLGLGFQIHLEK